MDAKGTKEEREVTAEAVPGVVAEVEPESGKQNQNGGEKLKGKLVPKPKKKERQALPKPEEDADLEPEEDAATRRKREAVMLAASQVEKRFGKGAVVDMGMRGAIVKVDTFSSGSLSLDDVMGVGGFPRGRIMEVFGPESSGKTTLALHAIAECQKVGDWAYFIDAEHALDPTYAQNLGVRMDRLMLSQPDCGEQALEIADTVIRSEGFGLVVVDSVAALVPKSELEGDMGDSHMGLQARLMGQATRKIAGIAATTKTSVIFVNQIREKIGVMFGNPEVTPGGRALKFYSTIRLEIRSAGQIKEGDNVVGNRVRVKVVKNKVAPPFRVAEFDIIWGRGIVRSREVLDLATDLEILEKKGSVYYFEGEKLENGRPKVILFLEENPDILSRIEELVRERLMGKKCVPSLTEGGTDE